MDSDGIRKLLAEATPGPWYSEEKPGMKAMGQPSNIGVWSEHKFNAALVSDDEDIDPKDEAWIAGIWGILCDEDRANARLIAAAPDLAAEVLRLRDLLGRWVNIATHCDITDGSCCCGDDMKNHPQQTGHYPVDHGAYVADQTLQDTLAALGETPDA